MDKYSVKVEETTVISLEIPVWCFNGKPSKEQTDTLKRINSLLNDYQSDIKLTMKEFCRLDYIKEISEGMTLLKFNKEGNAVTMTMYKRSYVIRESAVKESRESICQRYMDNCEEDCVMNMQQIASINNAMSLLSLDKEERTEDWEYEVDRHARAMFDAGIEGQIVDHFRMIAG